MSKTALLDKLRICRLNIGGSYDVPYLVDKDIVEPIGVVTLLCRLFFCEQFIALLLSTLYTKCRKPSVMLLHKMLFHLSAICSAGSGFFI